MIRKLFFWVVVSHFLALLASANESDGGVFFLVSAEPKVIGWRFEELPTEGWIALENSGGNCSLKDARLSLKAPKRRPYKVISAIGSDASFFFRGLNLRQGGCQCINTQGDSTDISYLENPSYAAGRQLSVSTSTLNKVPTFLWRGNRFYLKIEKASEGAQLVLYDENKERQAVYKAAKNERLEDFYIAFAGDLDRDSKLDLILSFEDEDRKSHYVLYLSQSALPGEIVHEVSRIQLVLGGSKE